MTKADLLRSVTQVFENLEFLYGRYVLGFAQIDQVNLANLARDGAEIVAEKLKAVGGALRRLGSSRWPVRGGLALLFAASALAAGFLARRVATGRSPFGGRDLPAGSAAYRKLQRVLRGRGADLTPASAPAETLASAERLGAGRVSREIVRAYVAESFGGLETSPDRGGAARRPPQGAPGRSPSRR